MSLRFKRQIRKQRKKNILKQKDNIWEGMLGDSNGVVKVPGQSEFRYVRPLGDDLAIVVRRGPVSDIAGTRVWVGKDPYNKKVRRILGLNSGVTQVTTGVENHAPSHYENSTDPVWITDQQITPLRTYATTGMNVHVNRGMTIYQGQSIFISSTDIDLSSSIPGSGARYSLIRVSSAGVIDVQDGDLVDSLADLSYDDIPVCENGYAPIAYARLYFGQTAFSTLYTNPDIKMLVWGSGLFDISGFGGFNDAEGNPVDVDATAAADGTSTYSARRDHRHHLGDHDHVEADITDLDHDAVKIQGFAVTTDNPADDQILRYSSGSGKYEVEDLPNIYDWSVLTDGDLLAPELIFAGGDVIMVKELT